MQSVYEAIGEPNRRAILSYLAPMGRSVNEIETALNLPQTTVSKHLRVLRDVGLVESTVAAQRRIYRVNSKPLEELDAWLEQFRRLWQPHLDALERHLDRLHGTESKEKREKS